MRRLFIISIFVSIATLGEAQQLTQPTLVGMNLFDVNPAFAGQYGRQHVMLRHRNQWQGFDGAPVWNNLSWHGPINNTKLGVGARIWQEEIGAFQHVGGMLSVSWSSKLTENLKLSAGLSGGVDSWQLDAGGLIGLDGNEYINLDLEGVRPQLAFGMLLRSRKAFFGVSAQNITQSDWETEVNAIGEDVVHALVHLGREFKLNDQWYLRTVANGRFISLDAPSIEGQAGLWYRKQVMLGAGYRSSQDVYGFLEVQLKNRFRVGYAYEWNHGNLGNAQNGSHELFLGMLFGNRQEATNKMLYLP